mmetsp:Transcript_21707/g.32322  ORF Transcript_21707/g.32322 Transcript_21707/m.32322 type:complete len:88 (+) Transcript_21707:2303-2566(+)
MSTPWGIEFNKHDRRMTGIDHLRLEVIVVEIYHSGVLSVKPSTYLFDKVHEKEGQNPRNVKKGTHSRLFLKSRGKQCLSKDVSARDK